MNNCAVVIKPVIHLVGLSYCGPYSAIPDEAIRLQSEFLSRKHEILGEVDTNLLHCPYFGNEVFVSYLACWEVAGTHLDHVPEGMVQFTIPERTYAMVRCTNKRIGEGYETLLAWMNEQRLVKRDNAVSLEIYYIDEHLEEEPVDLLIPIDHP